MLLPGIRFGGTERHGADLAAGLASRGIAVTLSADPELLAAWPATLPMPPVWPAAIGWDEAQTAEANTARQAAALPGLLSRVIPDAVLISAPWPNAGLGLQRALASTSLPRILLLHLVADGPPPGGIVPMRPMLGLDATILAAVSTPAARRAAHVFGLAEGSVAVLHNPAPTAPMCDRATARQEIRLTLGLPHDAPVLLFLGRLEEAKGADLLPDIGDRLPVTIAIAGDGMLRGLLDARARADPRGLLRVLGPVADPTRWLVGADALLLPSRMEGAPLVFLEAAASRCPVIATAAAMEALGGNAHRLARIVAQPNAALLAAAAESLLANPTGARAMVDAAAAHAARRSPAAALEDTLGLLRAAMLRAILVRTGENTA